MESLLHDHGGSFAILTGLLFFILLATQFNNIRMSKVGDRSVAGLCIVVSALCGGTISTLVYVLVLLFTH